MEKLVFCASPSAEVLEDKRNEIRPNLEDISFCLFVGLSVCLSSCLSFCCSLFCSLFVCLFLILLILFLERVNLAIKLVIN